MGTFGGNGEEVIEHKHRFFKTDHVEAIVTDSRRDMGDDQGRIIMGSGGNAVENDLYRETTGNHGTLGCIAYDI